MELPLDSALAASACPWWWLIPARNHGQVRDFAKATGKLAKTDALDAQLLAHSAAAVRPSIRPLRTEEAQKLNPLTTRRNQVMTMLVGEKNRLRQATRSVRPRVEAHVNWLERELKDLDKDLRQTLQQSPIWR